MVQIPRQPRFSIVDCDGSRQRLIIVWARSALQEGSTPSSTTIFVRTIRGSTTITPPTLSWRVIVEQPKARGEKTEAILIAEFVKYDFKVLLPFGDNLRYDLVLDTPNGFKRVQCKTGRLNNNSVVFSVCSTRINTKGWHRLDYHGDVDYFAVYCYENQQAYVVPINRVGKKCRSLRITPFRIFGNNLKQDILMAEDFKLESFCGDVG